MKRLPYEGSPSFYNQMEKIRKCYTLFSNIRINLDKKPFCLPKKAEVLLIILVSPSYYFQSMME